MICFNFVYDFRIRLWYDNHDEIYVTV